MSKIIQYRCPACSRLLIKWETGTEKVLYVDPQVRMIDIEGRKTKDIICSKCNTRSEVCSDGLRKIELAPRRPIAEHAPERIGVNKLSSDTSELPELANHIAIPA